MTEDAISPPAALSYVDIEVNSGRSDMRWVRIRARGSEWSWLTPDEAVAVGRHLIERFGKSA